MTRSNRPTNNEIPDEISDDSIEETKRMLRERRAPLDRARTEWQAWSEVTRAKHLMHSTPCPERPCEGILRLIPALRYLRLDDVFDRIEAELLPVTREVIRLARSGKSLEAIVQRCKAWEEEGLRPFAIRQELGTQLPRLLDRELQINQQLDRAMHRTMDATDEIFPSSTASQLAAPPRPVTIQSVGVDMVRVSRGHYSVEIKGPSLHRLFRLIADAPVQTHGWKEIETAWFAMDNGVKFPPSRDTLQRYARTIRHELGELGVYWQCDSQGVRWMPPTD